ncbi:Amino acid adenylation domain-containing protein [Sulfidibacter corallicola]|uniref:Amino acid adenylation domain-containing protein n=1 Tax=Sulfidibacter corallicola TaxID=2818388 RepID=A0A8A4TQ20_SULCO|nr:non-ribosomal peptide synthetase [Sulfidibacter corallicola]QTD51643.1 amino acid adenylation domain-containing protein [Sulfidibacter corallicola]
MTQSNGTESFLLELHRRDIRLDLDGDRLKINAPKGALTPELRTRLRDRKAELIGFLASARQASRQAVGEAIPARGDRSWAPLAALQRGLLLHRARGDDRAYHEYQVFLIEGHLDLRALEHAFRAVVSRHEILRTTFGERDGEPVQRIHAEPRFDFEVEPPATTSAGQAANHEAVLSPSERNHLRTWSQAPFSMDRGPLLRVLVLRRQTDRALLAVNMHHIVCDNWSFGLLLREVIQGYRANLAGTDPALPRLSLQFGDFTAAHAGDDLTASRAFWRERLAQMPTVLDLPVDRVRSQRGTPHAARWSATLPAHAFEPLLDLAASTQSTPFAALAAVWAAVLGRFAGQSRLLLGTPVDLRRNAEAEHLLGPFVNTLPLPFSLDAAANFPDLLKHASLTIGETFEHKALPFDEIASLAPTADHDRRPETSPLIQVVFVLRQTPLDAQASEDGDDLHIVPLNLAPEKAKFDLVIAMDPVAEGYQIQLEFNQALFEPERIAWLGQAFEQALAQWPALATCDVVRLPLAAPSETAAVPPAKPAKRPRNLVRRFADAVARDPNAKALTWFDGSGQTHHVDYGTLDRDSNLLAAALHERGIGLGSRVGLCLPPHRDLIVAMLAVLKTGAAYVPIDPHAPPDRRAFVAGDAALNLVLATGETGTTLLQAASGASVAVPCLSPADLIASSPAERTSPFQSPELPLDLPAYIIYTSGTTGRPKGALLSHRNVARLMDVTRPRFAFDHHDVWTLFHSSAFDFSVWEIWGALLYGGRLVLVPESVRRTPSAFAAMIYDQGVTVLNQTPSAFRELIRAEREASRHTSGLRLRLVVFGGEALQPETLRPWFDRHGDQWPRLVNMYGITETCVHVTWHELSRKDLRKKGLCIGEPLPDLEIHLLDSAGHPVHPGLVGEMCIGGAGLAHGYLGRPALTAERFVPHPSDPGKRLYRSGDLARRLPGGGFEYLGRNDFQVKVRGYRIELGEIEAQLQGLEAIETAVVITHRENDEPAILVAYLVATPGYAPEPEPLRRKLARTLPDYMVPGIFVILDQLPLTANGKLDRRALPDPRSGARRPDQPTTAARTPLEADILGIWGELFRRDDIGIHDNFLDLGGHSITAARFVARARKKLKLTVTVGDLFTYPTVAALAGELGMAQPEVRQPIPAATGMDVHPLSRAQRRMWILRYLDNSGAAYNIPAFFRLRGLLNVTAFEQAWHLLVQRHEPLRTSFELAGDQPVQRIADEVEAPVFRQDFRDHRVGPTEIARWADEEAGTHFDLGQAPLFRVSLVRLGQDDWLFGLTLHHIIADGWSLELLLHELTETYNAIKIQRHHRMPPLEIQYKDFSVWHNHLLASGQLAESRDYWHRQLRNAEGTVPRYQLRTDLPRPAVRRFDGAVHPFIIDRELTADMRRLRLDHGVSLQVLLTALVTGLLYRHGAGDDLIVGTPFGGRERIELEPLMGCFVNTLPLRNRPRGDLPFSEFLNRVAQTQSQAQAHREYPFDLLCEELLPHRDPTRAPLFDVFLVVRPGDQRPLALRDLDVQMVDEQPVIARFDLTFYFSETNDGQIRAAIEYASSLFRPATIGRMVHHFQALTRDAAARPLTALKDLEMLPRTERNQLTGTFARAPIGRKRDESDFFGWFDRFRAHDAQALIHAGSAIGYRELHDRVDRMAAYLRDQGVGAETSVALVLPRGLGMVLSALAVLRAGGTFVPIDPENPRTRVAQIVQQARAFLIVSEEDLAELVQPVARETGLPVRLWHAPEMTATEPAPNWPPIHPEQAAYICHTSGSTGRPKGVVVSRVNLAHATHSLALMYGIQSKDRFVQFFTPAFDGWILEIFPALSRGAAVVLTDSITVLDANAFKTSLRANEVTLALLPPSYLAEMETDDLPHLRTLSTAGEAARAEEVARQIGDRDYLNVYGPTEITVACASHRFRRGGAAPLSDVPLGRPLTDVRLYVLDKDLQPSPVGVPGEIFVGGSGVTRGYQGQPAQTAEAFIPDPFGEGARLYRTGDLGYWDDKGRLRFMGRGDHQVKWRGFRIELGEIAAVLEGHPDVVRACPLLVDGSRLVAFFTGSAEPAELASWLDTQLPAYMRPSHWLALPSLPHNHSGKIDRGALRARWSAHLRQATTVTEPQSPWEQRLAPLVAEALALEAVDRDTNFFDLGADSLSMIRLQRLLRERLECTLPVVRLFEYQTLATLAAYLERGTEAAAPRAARARGAARRARRAKTPT